jgi:exodeoxyribonuclease VII small subunit
VGFGFSFTLLRVFTVPKANKPDKFNFEEALASLEQLVEAMEQGDLSLEESLKAFEQGIKLTRECQTALEQAEQKVQLLVKDGHLPEAVPYASDGLDADEDGSAAP